ncbi:hypothetical protein CTheo_1732 [Ceratobasidium theobromae]|uniref:N-acetyltransferase domain-containing protein n=1 Tax=Ceratobasidium theobromae TaxID=1582974 RepID=A0A5N5QT74_9AGAM|nr:hypothetical protein CTheo_1732 [Ceratobasidium theobromae]
MQPMVQLGPDDQHPFPLLVTTSKSPRTPDELPLVENFRIEEMSWANPVGADLRDAQQAELDDRYGEPGKEPGIKPSADDITLFLVAYPIPIIHNPQSDKISKIESTPIACGALRHLEEGYMEIKRMYAVPSVRGSGAALAILLSLERYARVIGVKGLKLETGNLQGDAMA